VENGGISALQISGKPVAEGIKVLRHECAYISAAILLYKRTRPGRQEADV